jgi:DNA polymerase III alpha subunit
VKLVGSAIGRRERTSQKGSRYAFVQFSDTSGVYEVVMFAEALSAPGTDPGVKDGEPTTASMRCVA